MSGALLSALDVSASIKLTGLKKVTSGSPGVLAQVCAVSDGVAAEVGQAACASMGRCCGGDALFLDLLFHMRVKRTLCQ